MSDAAPELAGIRCPTCGAITCVVETRASVRMIRRRRRCTVAGCPGRVTTVEIASVTAYAVRDMVLVPRSVLATLRELLDRTHDPAARDEATDPETDAFSAEHDRPNGEE